MKYHITLLIKDINLVRNSVRSFPEELVEDYVEKLLKILEGNPGSAPVLLLWLRLFLKENFVALASNPSSILTV